MRRVAAHTILLVCLATVFASAAGADSQATPSSSFKSCAPPPGTFFTSVKVSGVGCSKARKVLTKGDCADPRCSDTTYGSWRCHTKGGIAFRTTRCKNGSRRIVATASGD